MQQQIRFCKTADGVRLAYASVGAGEPPLVKAANWLSHVEYDWRTPVWRPFLERLARNRRVVRYDARGCGLSDWDVDEYSLEVWVRDLEAVVVSFGQPRVDNLDSVNEEVLAGAMVAVPLRLPSSKTSEPDEFASRAEESSRPWTTRSAWPSPTGAARSSSTATGSGSKPSAPSPTTAFPSRSSSASRRA